MSRSRCKFCNQVIDWIEVRVVSYKAPNDGTVSYRAIPVDPKPQTWQFDGSNWIRSSALVEHFFTCKNPPTVGEEKIIDNNLPTKRHWWMD